MVAICPPLNRGSQREVALISSSFGWSGLASAATRFTDRFHDFGIAHPDLEPGCRKPVTDRRSNGKRSAGLQPAYRVAGESGFMGSFDFQHWTRIGVLN